MRALSIRLLLSGALASSILTGGLAGCGDNFSPDPVTPADPDPDAAPEPDAPPAAACSTTEVPCVDDAILDLSLHDDRVSEGDVVNAPDGAGFVSTLDATAGGFGQSNEHAFLYLRFEEAGLVKVDIDDETALESEDWHIAARRFIVRLNGGTSGIGCVGAAAQTGRTYDEITSVPAGAEFVYDRFYDDSCTIVEDGSGLPGSPLVALDGWWMYTSCVTTTGTPFVVQLDDDRHVKLEIQTYYGTGQTACNSGGTPGGSSGTLTVRWQFL